MRTALSTVISLALVLGGCTGCSSTLSGLLEGPKPPNFDGIRPVTARTGIGHVCVVGDQLALTANHVEGWRSSFDPPYKTMPVPLMGELDGRPLTLFRVWSDMRRDISMVGIVGQEKFPKVYPLAKELPKPGDWLWIRGFNVYKGFEGIGIRVKVLNVEMGNIYTEAEDGPHPGSSGSCMLNEDEEVVGIYVAAYGERRPEGKMVWMGNGELVAGDWGTFHENFIEKGAMK